jgi:hypothetical protein
LRFRRSGTWRFARARTPGIRRRRTKGGITWFAGHRKILKKWIGAADTVKNGKLAAARDPRINLLSFRDLRILRAGKESAEYFEEPLNKQSNGGKLDKG